MHCWLQRRKLVPTADAGNVIETHQHKGELKEW
jgi:hypothetical protein